VTGDLSDDRWGFLTIFDNVLTVGGLARARVISPASASISRPSRRSWRRYEKWRTGERRRGAPAVVKACEKLPRPTLKKAKNKCGSILTV
jgi:hypothetical protein